MKIYLASKSPRRKEILSMLPFEFKIHIPNFNEEEYELRLKKDGINDVLELTKLLTRQKAIETLNELKENAIIISADTIVYFNGKIYGKPINKENAKQMLQELRNNKHKVISAVCILTKDEKIEFISETEVYFDDYSDSLIDYYIKNYNPLDKAGSYGIQDAGAIFVKKIEGSFHNVMGLPINELYKNLKKIIK